MPTAPRLYVPLDASFYDDPAVLELMDAGEYGAVHLFVYALTLAKRLGTDGDVTFAQLRRLPGMDDESFEHASSALVDSGLIRVDKSAKGRARGAVTVTAWTHWNDDTVTRALRADANAARQRRYRERHRDNGRDPEDQAGAREETRNEMSRNAPKKEKERVREEREALRVTDAQRDAPTPEDHEPPADGEPDVTEPERSTVRAPRTPVVALADALAETWGERVDYDEVGMLAAWCVHRKLDAKLVLAVAERSTWPSEVKAELSKSDGEPTAPAPTFDADAVEQARAVWEAERADELAQQRIGKTLDQARNALKGETE